MVIYVFRMAFTICLCKCVSGNSAQVEPSKCFQQFLSFRCTQSGAIRCDL
jgi:hypothetical protein